MINMSPNASQYLYIFENFSYIFFGGGVIIIEFCGVNDISLLFFMWNFNNIVCNFSALSRGAKLCVVKSQRKEKQAETLTQDYIITRKFIHVLYSSKQTHSQSAFGYTFKEAIT